MVYVSKKAPVAVRQLHKAEFAHRYIVTVKGLVSPFLHYCISIFKAHVRQVSQSLLSIKWLGKVLLYSSVFIGLCKTQPQAAVTLGLQPETLSEYLKIKLEPERSHYTESCYLLSFIAPYPLIMHILGCCKQIFF